MASIREVVRAPAPIALVASLAVAAGMLAAAAAAAPRAAPPRAPALAGVTLDGTRASLAALRGRPVLVNVWSSW